MSFIGGNTNKLTFVLTKLGQKTLAEKGLENTIKYYTLYDSEVNYRIDAYPYLMVDVCGSNKTIIPNSIIFRDELIP
jgi:hypothetical protein